MGVKLDGGGMTGSLLPASAAALPDHRAGSRKKWGSAKLEPPAARPAKSVNSVTWSLLPAECHWPIRHHPPWLCVWPVLHGGFMQVVIRRLGSTSHDDIHFRSMDPNADYRAAAGHYISSLLHGLSFIAWAKLVYKTSRRAI